MCTLSERDRTSEVGVSSSRGMREEVGMRRPGAVRIQAGAGHASVLGHTLGTCEGLPVCGEHHTWENSLSSEIKVQKGKISLKLFFFCCT